MKAKHTKPSWEDLWATINYLEHNKGMIGSWDVIKSGTWAKNEHEITIKVRIYEIETNEQHTLAQTNV